VILVSHDRAFLDNVVTQVLAYDGDGRWVENPGGHSEWQAYLARRSQGRTAERVDTTAKPAPAAEAPPADKRKSKMSYKDTRELESLPGRIAALEKEQEVLAARLANPATYNEAGTDVGALNARVAEIEAELLGALERWEELEARR